MFFAIGTWLFPIRAVLPGVLPAACGFLCPLSPVLLLLLLVPARPCLAWALHNVIGRIFISFLSMVCWKSVHGGHAGFVIIRQRVVSARKIRHAIILPRNDLSSILHASRSLWFVSPSRLWTNATIDVHQTPWCWHRILSPAQQDSGMYIISATSLLSHTLRFLQHLLNWTWLIFPPRKFSCDGSWRRIIFYHFHQGSLSLGVCPWRAHVPSPWSTPSYIWLPLLLWSVIFSSVPPLAIQ